MPSSAGILVIVGGQKCGTSWLADALSRSQHVEYASTKEPNFFLSESGTNAGLEAFARATSPVVLDASTAYSFVREHPGVVARIAQHSSRSRLRIVLIVRDPIARVESHLRHRAVRGRLEFSADEEVQRRAEYVDRSRFGEILAKYSEYLTRDMIHVISFEGMFTDPVSELRPVERAITALSGSPADLEWDVTAKVNDARAQLRLPRALRSVIGMTPRPIRSAARWARPILPRGPGDPSRIRLSHDTKHWIREKLADDQRLLKELLDAY